MAGLGLNATVVNKAGGPEPNAYSVVASGEMGRRVSTPWKKWQRPGATGSKSGAPPPSAASPCYTSLDTAKAALESLVFGRGEYCVAPTVDYVRGTVKSAK